MDEPNEHVEKIDELLDRLEADKQTLDELALDLEVDGERIERMDKAVWDALGIKRRRPDPSLLDLLREISTTQGVLVTLLEQLTKMLPQPEGPGSILGDEWKNVSISHGTLRPQDLIPAYVEMLEQHWPAKATRILSLLDPEWPMEATSSNPDLSEAMVDEMAEERPELVDGLLSDLAEALETIAPDGCYFGSHPGDGSDLGFWVGEGNDADPT